MSFVKEFCVRGDIIMTETNVLDKEIKRGEIWACEHNENIPALYGLFHTCLIIQNDGTNKDSKFIVIVPLISAKRLMELDKRLKNEELGSIEVDIKKTIYVQHLHTIPKINLNYKLATLHQKTMKHIGKVLSESLGFSFTE
jgi:mRNA-degrading endonuclease toxin of MazEF toxin-antitoxin module